MINFQGWKNDHLHTTLECCTVGPLYLWDQHPQIQAPTGGKCWGKVLRLLRCCCYNKPVVQGWLCHLLVVFLGQFICSHQASVSSPVQWE